MSDIVYTLLTCQQIHRVIRWTRYESAIMPADAAVHLAVFGTSLSSSLTTTSVRVPSRVWIITITGAEGTIYAGEKFRLRVSFPEDYPTKPPAVYFLQSPPPPKHQVGSSAPYLY